LAIEAWPPIRSRVLVAHSTNSSATFGLSARLPAVEFIPFPL